MGFLDSLLGKKNNDGEALLAAGRFGEAKLAFERAMHASKDSAEKERLALRVDACLDKLAEGFIAEAERFYAEGLTEFAQQAARNAVEVAASDELKQKALDLVHEREAAKAVASSTIAKLTDEDKWVFISAQFEDAQWDEYEGMLDALRPALIELRYGDAAKARDALEVILEASEAPRYLWLEVARARSANEDDDGAHDALLEFIDSMADDERHAALLGAYLELARLSSVAGDDEEARAYYDLSIELFPEDPRPYYARAAYENEQGEPKRAVATLLQGGRHLHEERPDPFYLELLGLTQADAGDEKDAIATLELVVSIFANKHDFNYPWRTASKLAELQEKHGELGRAADLWARLAEGSHVERHGLYHREAGRVLKKLGLAQEAERMLKRALALAGNDNDERTRIEGLLSS